MPDTADHPTRERILRTAVRHYWRGGLAGTGVQVLLQESGAARGSLYFHFPGGKNELAEQALRQAADAITAQLRECLRTGPSVAGALQAFVAGYTSMASNADFTVGCPLAIATLEGGDLPGPRAVAARTFRDWEELIAGALIDEGVDEVSAGERARLVISGLEGALIMSRAAGDARALRTLEVSIPTLVG